MRTDTEELWGATQAAHYLQLESRYLIRQCRRGTGPAYLKPSPKKILFRKSDLDAWRSCWEVHQLTAMTIAE